MPFGASLASVAGERNDDGTSTFPAAYVADTADANLDEVVRWISENAESLVSQAAETGAVLFRGFPIVTDKDFDAFITAFGLPNFKYEDSLSNAVRVVRTERVFTANEAPPDVRICLHHEMAQTPVYPSRLFFFCEKAAEEGGETPLCRSDVLFDRMTLEMPEFAADCANKGLKYSHVMPAANDAASGMGRSWQSTLRSETKEQAEERLRSLGYTWTWLDDGCLKVTTPVLQAVRQLSNGKTAFFNQLIAAFHGWKDSRNDPTRSITFGDGTPLDPATMQRVIEMAEEITFDMRWQNGDVVLVDNYVAMHGRRVFKGTRRVLASLVAS
ncbi:MAG: TauD/TfdA family dioxygenase [Planctomycetaceae bacterium]|nr:TauD/TfdA family dioxygenase [Planctomycetaceae bacterium]